MQCPAHPALPALHECTACGAWLCDDCVRRVATPGKGPGIPACSRCGGLARRVAELVPVEPRRSLRELARPLLTEDAVLAVVALAVPFGLTAIVGGRGFGVLMFVYASALSGYYFQTVDHVGQGRPGLPFSMDATTRWDLARALARGLVCLLVACGPAVAGAIIFGGWDPILLALVAFGIAFTPAAILAVVLTQNALNGAWPLVWAAIIARAPGAYARLVGFFAASIAGGGLVILIASLTLARIPLLGPLLLGLVVNAAVLLQAGLVGRFLHRHAAEFGYD